MSLVAPSLPLFFVFANTNTDTLAHRTKRHFVQTVPPPSPSAKQDEVW